MATYKTDIQVCGAAMSRLGMRPMRTMQDGSKEAQILLSAYPGIVSDLLCAHAWRFAQKLDKLTYQGVQADGSGHVYTYPEEAENVRVVTMLGEPLDAVFATGGKVVLRECYDDVYIVYNYIAPERLWPPDFCEVVVTKLVSVLYRAAREDEANADRMDLKAEALKTRAMVRDKRQSTGVPAPEQPFQKIFRGSNAKRF